MAEPLSVAELRAAGLPTVRERLALIKEECASPLGFAQRGVSSWDQELLHRWMERAALRWGHGSEFTLGEHEEAILKRIERQVYGDG